MSSERLIVIHAGLRKSGSTSIQNFMAANTAVLRRWGVDYPEAGRIGRKSHLNLGSELRGRKNFDPNGGTMAEVAAHWKRSDAHTLVISSETLEECDTDQAARLGREIAAGGERFRVILVLRDLISLMPSSYAEMVKVGLKTHDFDSFFEKRIGERRVNYFQTAERWAGAFGWDALRVRLLDSRFLKNGDLEIDFLAQIGLDLTTEQASELKRPEPSNVAPGWRVVEAVRALYGGRIHLPPGHPLGGWEGHTRSERKRLGDRAAHVGEAIGWNADRGLYMRRDQAQLCLGIHREAIAELNTRLPDPLPEPPELEARGFRERAFLPDASRIPPRMLRAFIDEVGDPPPPKAVKGKKRLG